MKVGTDNTTSAQPTKKPRRTAPSAEPVETPVLLAQSLAPNQDRQPLQGGGSVSEAIRVLCVDDHAVLVEGLKAQFAIEGKLEIVGRLASAAKLVDEALRLRPDVVLLDIEMPGPDAFETADRLRRICPGVCVVVLSAHIRDAFITASFSAGVRAYFSKSEDLNDIVNGIREVVRNGQGSFVLGPKVRERCRPAARARGPIEPEKRTHEALDVGRRDLPLTLLSSLTTREADVLRLIGRGLSRQQIAKQLSRSVKTIDGHQERMLKKLGIASRSDLMRFSIREGLAEA